MNKLKLAPSVLFILLAVALIFKASWLVRPDLIFNYPFITYDGFQWMTDSLHYSNNYVDVTQRNPAIPLVFAVLRLLNIVDFFPAILCLLTWLFYFGCYRFTREFVGVTAATFATFVFIFVFKLHNFFDFILADPWTITLIVFSIRELLVSGRDERHLRLFALYLGLSVNFQFTPAFLAPAFIWYFTRPEIFKFWINRPNILLQSCAIFLCLAFPQFIYKWIHFGNPLYSHVIHFPLVEFHLFGLVYYALNFLAWLGFPLACFVIWGFTSTFKSKETKIQFVHMLFTCMFVFWVLFYTWLDTRFLIYLFPFWFVYFAILAEKIDLVAFFSWKKKSIPEIIWITLFGLFILSMASHKTSAFDGGSLQLSPQNVLKFDGRPIGKHRSSATIVDGVKSENYDDSMSLTTIISYFKFYRQTKGWQSGLGEGFVADARNIGLLLETNKIIAPEKLSVCSGLSDVHETKHRLFWMIKMNFVECDSTQRFHLLRISDLNAFLATHPAYVVEFSGSELALVKNPELVRHQ